MNLNIDRLAARLEADLGALTVDGATERLVAHAVDGRTPSLVCTPANPDQIAAALRICNESHAAVTPWGGGTAMRLGNVPRAYDVALLTTQLKQLAEHDYANLTATVQAGISLVELQSLLAPHKQHVAFDVPFAVRSTIGGIVAANLNGARRGFSGSVRDLVIGIKVALAPGEQIKAGGKVVKNVAGYDMCKLFVGSLGTLGVITEVTLRMAALPEQSVMMTLQGRLSTALQFLGGVERSALLPAAVLLSHRLGANPTPDHWQLTVILEGFVDAVARQVENIRELATPLGLTAELMEDTARENWWEMICDFPLSGESCVYRLNVPRAAVGVILKTVYGWKHASSDPITVSDVVAGVIWIALTDTRSAKDEFARLLALAREYHGHAVIFAARAETKSMIDDVWGPPPATAMLMHEIKRQFDPNYILNPGRFISGL